MMRYSDLHPVIRATIEGRDTSDIPYVSPFLDDSGAPQWCYVIQCGHDGPVKIGVASDPERRRSLLQVGSPTELYIRHLFEGGYKTEAALHRHYDNEYLRGEWFTKDVLLDIETVANSLAKDD